MATHQAAGAIAAVHARLGNQHPAFVACAEQARKRVSFAPTVLPQRVVHRIVRFITRGSSGKPAHRPRLRTEECRAPLGKDKARGLLLHHGTQAVALGIDLILESHIVVADTEDDVNGRLSAALITEYLLIGLIMHFAPLDGRHGITLGHATCLRVFQEKPLGEVAHIGVQAKRRNAQERLPIVVHPVSRFPTFSQIHIHGQFPVGTDHLFLFCHGAYRHREPCKCQYTLFHVSPSFFSNGTNVRRNM